MRRFVCAISLALTLLGWSRLDAQPKGVGAKDLLPLPAVVKFEDKGHYTLTPHTRITLSSGLRGEEADRVAELLRARLEEVNPLLGKIDVRQGKSINRQKEIWLELDSVKLQGEAYRLQIDRSGIALTGGSLDGLRMGVQTIAQLATGGARLSYCLIEDQPRFRYRGLMLDESRHFMGKEFVIKLLDEMSRYKFNRFHWHLVDGGGWRLPIDKYPLLIEKASTRTQSDWDAWWHARDRRFVDVSTLGAYGGSYSKDDIRGIVQYAAERGITIVPEIELPGHSNEVAAAYPEIFCQGKWDEDTSDVCIGNEKTFEFFENVLLETMDLFPSEYIHIGGDEAVMNRWGDCPKCQQRMKDENLKDLHELQSYMIKRIERFLKSHGRKLLGWDEIIMGGLPADATVMSWRGEAGGIQAASAGHDVVMTPNNYLYLDYYQTYGSKQPRAIGGYVPLEQSYSYDPIPEALSADKRHHILGVQGNLWTEYVTSAEHAFYMYFPRAIAIAEIGWTPKEKKDYESFRRRVSSEVDRQIKRGLTPYRLTSINHREELDAEGKKIKVSFTSEKDGAEIYYTTDGSLPTRLSDRYVRPIEVSDSLILTAISLDEKSDSSEANPLTLSVDYHKGIGKSITYAGKGWNSKYPAQGAKTLIDGVKGGHTYMDKSWLGFTDPLEATVDLGREEDLSRISVRFMQEIEQWVYMPRRVEVLISSDGENYRSLGVQSPTSSEVERRPLFETFTFLIKDRARYVRLKADIDRPEGHFIFVDELVIH